MNIKDDFLTLIVESCDNWILWLDNETVSLRSYNGQEIKIIENKETNSILLIGLWPKKAQNPYTLKILSNVNEYPIKRIYLNRKNKLKTTLDYMKTYVDLYNKCLQNNSCPVLDVNRNEINVLTVKKCSNFS